MLSVDIIEFAWVVINLTAFVLTLVSLFDARADRIAVRLLNGLARELAATGILRRELIRLVIQALLLSLVIPGLFSDRVISLSLPVVALMSVAILLLLQTFLDARERKALTALVAADVIAERSSEYAELKGLVLENAAISSEGVAAAERAYEVANSLNLKLERQGDALIQQGEDRARREDAT